MFLCHFPPTTGSASVYRLVVDRLLVVLYSPLRIIYSVFFVVFEVLRKVQQNEDKKWLIICSEIPSKSIQRRINQW